MKGVNDWLAIVGVVGEQAARVLELDDYYCDFLVTVGMAMGTRGCP